MALYAGLGQDDVRARKKARKGQAEAMLLGGNISTAQLTRNTIPTTTEQLLRQQLKERLQDKQQLQDLPQDELPHDGLPETSPFLDS